MGRSARPPPVLPRHRDSRPETRKKGAALALELLVTGVLLTVPALALILVPIRMVASSPTMR
jgi:hypothetical protein